MNASPRHQPLIRAWTELLYAPSPYASYPEFRWAFEQLEALSKDDPEEAWKLICAIMPRDSSDVILDFLAVGPVETLLVHHGREFIDRIESLATIDSNLARMLNVIYNPKIPDEVWQRVKTIVIRGLDDARA